MEIKSVFDDAFLTYGKVLEDCDFAPLLKTLIETTPKPKERTIYVPADKTMEALPVYETLTNRIYGGMPVQIGYCNGSNTKLNCLEYHRGSEVNIAADDIILLVAPLQKVRNGNLNTAEVEAFSMPAGTAVQLYETTLHYAPCNAPLSEGFRVAVVLPRGTNTEKPATAVGGDFESKLLWACNKWLIAHPESIEAKEGAFVGLTGENIAV